MVSRFDRRRFLVGLGANAACQIVLRDTAYASDDVAGAGLVAVPEPIEAPEIGLADLDGNIRRIADYRGKVVVISFWAAWCAPCRREMPSLARLNRELPPDDFAVLAVNLGDDHDRIREFLAQIDHDGLPILADEHSGLAKAWNIYGLPVSYVVDRAGQIRFGVLGAREWDSPLIRDQLLALAA